MRIYLAGTYSRQYVYSSCEHLTQTDIHAVCREREHNSLEHNAMQIYLAGGYTGNLRPYWDRVVTEPQLAETQNNIAGEHSVKNGTKIQSWQGLNILESYYYLRKNTNFERLLHTIPMNFLLDSGAFTFMQGNHGKVDISDYVNGYAEFINKHDIKLFFELDIDSVVGLEKVEQIRNRLEMLTGKKPIPVWHIGRGKQYFLDMCKAYPYVALGGIVSKEITNYEYFPWFISEAHKAGAKIHGLGFTQLASLRRYHFDSVDSTAWLYGNRGGYLYLFNPKATNLMEKITAPAGKGRLKSNESAMHNFKEWVKLSRWAEKNL